MRRSNHLSDQELIQSYQKTGDIKAVGSLYMRYSHLILGLCLKYLKNPDKAKDCSMDIFEKLTQKLRQHQVTHFKSWLYTTTKNHCLTILRKENKVASLSLDEQYQLEDTSLFSFQLTKLKENQYQALENALTQLKSDQRTCLQYFYFEHKSYDQISQMTQMDRKKVKSNIQNGKRNLKLILENNHVFKQ